MHSKMDKSGQKTRVVCAMSGGIDSSVVAALLHEQGYEVIGVTLQVRPSVIDSERAGSMLLAVEDARRVANRLGIAHHVFNVQKEFQQLVIDPFIVSYRRGETPNPCISCNKWIKYGLLMQKARDLGASYLATGHYARIINDPLTQRWHLRRGADAQKDQSYVLYGLTQDQLASTLFPLGEMTKNETRDIAHSLELSVAGKPESQEICFVPDNNYRYFMRDRAPDSFAQGEIVDEQGTVLRMHEGIANFTIGQRRGLGISANNPIYVTAIDTKNNRVVVGPESSLYSQHVMATDLVFGKIDADHLKSPCRVTAKVRSTMLEQPGVAQMVENKLQMIFDVPQRAITPGQAVVCYEGDDVLVGGTILRTEDSSDLP